MITEGILTKSYSKEFTWEIENFVNWWSSRPIEEANTNDDAPLEEEMGIEEHKTGKKHRDLHFLNLK